MTETVQQLLRERAEDDRVGVRYGDRTWTWREHLAEAAAEASAVIALADPARPLHVGVLFGNTPDMLRSMAAAALGGYVLVGLNTTRRGPTSPFPWWTFRPSARCRWSTWLGSSRAASWSPTPRWARWTRS